MSKHRIVAEYRPTDKMVVTFESESTFGDEPDVLGEHAAAVIRGFEDVMYPIDWSPFLVHNQQGVTIEDDQ